MSLMLCRLRARPLTLSNESSSVCLSEGHAFCQFDEPSGPLRGFCGCSTWHSEGGNVSPRKLGGEEVGCLRAQFSVYIHDLPHLHINC